MSPGRAAFPSLEFVRASDLDDLRKPGRTNLVLAHATLLLHGLVPQKVALARGATQYLTGTGHLEFLGNGFTCFDHGKREERKERAGPCKANSPISTGKKRSAPPWRWGAREKFNNLMMDSARGNCSTATRYRNHIGSNRRVHG